MGTFVVLSHAALVRVLKVNLWRVSCNRSCIFITQCWMDGDERSWKHNVETSKCYFGTFIRPGTCLPELSLVSLIVFQKSVWSALINCLPKAYLVSLNCLAEVCLVSLVFHQVEIVCFLFFSFLWGQGQWHTDLQQTETGRLPKAGGCECIWHS